MFDGLIPLRYTSLLADPPWTFATEGMQLGIQAAVDAGVVIEYRSIG